MGHGLPNACGAKTPNKGIELTASSVRSCVAPASSRSSCLAFWRTRFARPPECGAHFVRSLVRQRASRRRTRLLHLPRRPSSLRLAVPRAGERRISQPLRGELGGSSSGWFFVRAASSRSARSLRPLFSARHLLASPSACEERRRGIGGARGKAGERNKGHRVPSSLFGPGPRPRRRRGSIGEAGTTRRRPSGST